MNKKTKNLLIGLTIGIEIAAICGLSGLIIHRYHSKEAKLERQEQIQHQEQINSKYNQRTGDYFSPVSTKQDSINFYMGNGLEKNIHFSEPSLEDKERIVENKMLEESDNNYEERPEDTYYHSP